MSVRTSRHYVALGDAVADNTEVTRTLPRGIQSFYALVLGAGTPDGTFDVYAEYLDRDGGEAIRVALVTGAQANAPGIYPDPAQGARPMPAPDRLVLDRDGSTQGTLTLCVYPVDVV